MEPVVERVEPYTGDEVRFSVDQGVALVAMNTRTNMFTDELLHGLEAAFAEIAGRDDIGAVVVTGNGGVFSMGATPEALKTLAAKQGRFTDVPFLYEGMLRCDRPVVVAIQGHASGGGLAFGLHADIVVMSRDGVYSANFMKYGFTPGMGATYVLEHRFGRSLAHEMLFTGRSVTGEELERRGANVTVLPQHDVLPMALRHARSIAGMPLPAVRALKVSWPDACWRSCPASSPERSLCTSVCSAASRSSEYATTSPRSRPSATNPPRTAPPSNPSPLPFPSPSPLPLPSPNLLPPPPPHLRPRSISLPSLRPRPSSSPSSLPYPLPSPSPSLFPHPPTSPSASASGLVTTSGDRHGADRDEVEKVVRETLGAYLYLESHEIEPNLSFSEMGLDSIGAVEIVRDLNRRFGVDLDSVAIYDHPTIPSLVDFVVTESDGSLAQAPVGTSGAISSRRSPRRPRRHIRHLRVLAATTTGEARRRSQPRNRGPRARSYSRDRGSRTRPQPRDKRHRARSDSRDRSRTRPCLGDRHHRVKPPR